MSTFWRYLQAQAIVFLVGIMGPIFLIAYFVSQPDPSVKWMYWVGLFVTTLDVLIALALTRSATRPRDAPKKSD